MAALVSYWALLELISSSHRKSVPPVCRLQMFYERLEGLTGRFEPQFVLITTLRFCQTAVSSKRRFKPGFRAARCRVVEDWYQ